MQCPPILFNNIEMYSVWITAMRTGLGQMFDHSHESLIQHCIGLSAIQIHCLLPHVPQIRVLGGNIEKQVACLVCPAGRQGVVDKGVVNMLCKKYCINSWQHHVAVARWNKIVDFTLILQHGLNKHVMPHRWNAMLLPHMKKCRNQILDLCTLARQLGIIASMMETAQLQVCELCFHLVLC